MILVVVRKDQDLVRGEAAPVAGDGLRQVGVKDSHVGHLASMLQNFFSSSLTNRSGTLREMRLVG
jgi:hypothetical protein